MLFVLIIKMEHLIKKLLWFIETPWIRLGVFKKFKNLPWDKGEQRALWNLTKLLTYVTFNLGVIHLWIWKNLNMCEIAYVQVI